MPRREPSRHPGTAPRRPPRRRARLVSMLVALTMGAPLGVLGAPAGAQSTAGTAGTAAGFTPAPITWTRCPEDRSLDCARLSVPLDTSRPGKERISLAVLRARATDPKRRLGVLLVNPGGPGGSAWDFASQLAGSTILSKIRQRYDIVGWDPRGVGRSAPVRCLDTAAYTRFYGVDPTPDDDTELDALVAVSKEFAAGCEKRNAALLRHVATADSVADMDWLRVALGEQKVSFLAFSYGTYLGVRYADRFPNRVGRFVLDGVLDPTVGSDDRIRRQAAGFERALNDFFQTCSPSTCTFAAKGETPVVGYDRLMAKLETTPLVVGSGASKRSVGPAESSTGVLLALYNVESGWPRLRRALNDAADGDGRGLLALFDLYTDRAADGSYGNISDANAAVNCADLPASKDLATYEDLARELARTAPHFGAFAAYSSLLCAYWPLNGPTPAAVKATGAAPILLIGTTRDPATPYPWAQSVQRQLAGSRLLTYDGDGHTAFLTGNACVRRNVEAYLLNGTMPAPDTICDRRDGAGRCMSGRSPATS